MKNYTKKILFLVLVLGFGAKTYAASTFHVNKNFDLVPNDKTTNGKFILITIDDGPNKADNDVVQILNKHNTKAIFFINGIHDKDNQGNIKMLYDAGFVIGNHTWDHKNLQKIKDANAVIGEIDSNNELIKKETGSNSKFFRPPYGMSTKFVRSLVKKEGMISMNWSGAAKDWETNTKDEKIFLSNVDKGLHSGEILLIHEHPWTVKYLDDLLTDLEGKGYSFVDPNQIKN